jgi:hypothetical protein
MFVLPLGGGKSRSLLEDDIEVARRTETQVSSNRNRGPPRLDKPPGELDALINDVLIWGEAYTCSETSREIKRAHPHFASPTLKRDRFREMVIGKIPGSPQSVRRE